MKKLKKVLIKAKNHFLYQVTDYYFVSYPKCGRTWTRYFLSQYLKRLCGRRFSLEFDNLIKFDYRYPRIIYTHAHHRQDDLKQTKKFADWLAKSDKKIIFLIRDPRDVVVSSYFQYTKRGDGTVVDSDIPLSEFITLPHTGIQKIVDYMNFWYQSRETFDDFLLLRYENLKDDPQVEFSKFINFLNIELDESVLRKAIEASAFEKMRQAEKSEKIEDSRLEPGDRSDEESYKTRRGKTGGYVDYFDGENLKAVNEAVSSLHEQLNYGE